MYQRPWKGPVTQKDYNYSIPMQVEYHKYIWKRHLLWNDLYRSLIDCCSLTSYLSCNCTNDYGQFFNYILDILSKSEIGLLFIKLCLSFDFYIGITFAILSFDRKTQFSIDLFTAMLSGNEMTNFICFSNSVFTLSCPQLVLSFREFMVFIISLLSVGRKYRDVAFLHIGK